MKQDITCVFEGVLGIGGIYISNLKAAKNQLLLQNLNIKAIVTAVRNANIEHDKEDVSDHLYIPADDHQSFDLSKYFQQTFQFIDQARKKTNVLVHCYAGISRSATIVIAYLLRKYNYSLDKVISMVKRRRNKINPNKGFIEQLKKQAAKMGISQNKKQDQIEQILNKSRNTSEKKRQISSYSLSSYQSEKLKANQQIKRNSNKKNEEWQMNKFQKDKYNFRQFLAYKNELQRKQGKVDRNVTTKSLNIANGGCEYTSPMKQEIQKIEQQARQRNILISQKLKKIEKLKEKVMSSQKQRKSRQKRIFSGLIETKQVHKTQTPAKYSNLSIKLKHDISTTGEGSGVKADNLSQKRRQHDIKKNSHINRILFNQSSVIF